MAAVARSSDLPSPARSTQREQRVPIGRREAGPGARGLDRVGPDPQQLADALRLAEARAGLVVPAPVARERGDAILVCLDPGDGRRDLRLAARDEPCPCGVGDLAAGTSLEDHVRPHA